MWKIMAFSICIVYVVLRVIIEICNTLDMRMDRTFFLQMFWLWKNRNWKNCRAKRRALQKYLDEKR